MLIKKKHINENLTEEFGAEAANVYDFYWKQIKQDILNLRHLEIFIPELGSFNVVKKKLDKMEAAVDRIMTYSKNKAHVKPAVQNIKKLYAERIELKNTKRKQRNEYLEKQVEDTRGDLV